MPPPLNCEPLSCRGNIDIRQDRGKLLGGAGANTTVKATGRDDWDGSILLKMADISEMARENTAKVVKSLQADVLCTVETENREALRDFDSQMLGNRYPFELLIDGNDPRGIDVGLYSKFPIRDIHTHIFDKGEDGRAIFSRDCLEVELELPGGKPLYMLCNHFKSQGYGAAEANDARRRKQAERVAEIVSEYNLKTDCVIVAGDLNDSPQREPHTLQALLDVENLFEALELQFPEAKDRWTYHYRNEFNQIDFLLISKPLKTKLEEAGVERRGIYKLSELTDGAEEAFDTVTSWSNAASDHAAVWAEFRL